ncbi:hypothetical protein PFISCL1PPCAC_18877, partial [Pristionchus fissidentatus]
TKRINEKLTVVSKVGRRLSRSSQKYMATASELMGDDARSRFSHTKALFEQLERQQELPSFYSPRPQRCPPPLPPKPQLQQQLRDGSPAAAAAACPTSPLSQVSRNFEQLASDLDRIRFGKPNGSPPLNNNNNSDISGYARPLSSSSSGGSSTSTHGGGGGTKSAPNGASNGTNYEPYWRDASFYKRRFEDAEEPTSGTRYQLVKTRKDEEDTVEVTERDERGLRVTRNREAMYGEGLMATMRGLSPERPHELENRKISFSTAPIPVYSTHSVDDYDRKNDDIDPVASCAEYELERRLERMELFEVELDKGSEGLGVSIIGMGVGADSGLEKLGIFVKSITPGGAVHRDGSIHVCDQIVSVDGKSLVGVSQLYAAETLRATTNRVHFTIGREPSLDDSEVHALIQQSLAADRMRSLPLEEEDEEDDEEEDGPPTTQPPAPPTVAAPLPQLMQQQHHQQRVPSALAMSMEESEIRAKIAALELEVELSQKKADQMHNVLDSTKEHYTQLERKYDQANALLRNYQEREKELLSREETHVEQLKEKDAHYANLVTSLKTRIDELEDSLEEARKGELASRKGELRDLKQKLDEEFGPAAKARLSHSSSSPPPLPTAAPPSVSQSPAAAPAAAATAAAHSEGAAYRPGGEKTAMETMMEEKVMTTKISPSSVKSHSKRDADTSYNSGWNHDDTRSVVSSSCDSPIPRVSEPASPALPHKFSAHRRLLFPLRKRYALNESEFWRASADQIQGLQVLHWSVDDICQLLVSMGLDKYIPEMTINKINGVKFLELDSSKLKTMGIQNHSDRSLIKKKVKMIKVRIERERKMLEKESRARAHAAHLTQSIPI